ncbi:MAG TPA: two-component regulator propeller domain-containing protein, partial [Bacteroidia bacterium]|nr:two-component regulator propeller domain-containing protein [Bacteroidia bacterium]
MSCNLSAQVIPFISEKSLATTEKYSVQYWTTENGLPQNSINDITQTNDGHLWIATFDGLVKFDGMKFTVYNTSNTPEFKINGIKRLFTDSKGKLWIIGADGSMTSYFHNKFYAHSIPSKALFYSNAITNWADNTILVACDNGKIYKIKNDEVVEFKTPAFIHHIHTILSKFDDQLYVGTETGLYSYTNGEWYIFNEFIDKDCSAFYRSPNNDIIVNTKNDLFIVHPKNVEHLTIPESLKNVGNFTLAFNEEKELTILSDQGLFIIQKNTVQHISTKNGLSSNNVGSAFVDKQNNFWVGTSSGGINKLKTKIFRTLNKEEGMNDDGTTGIIETNDKGILIANNCSGASQFLNGKFTGNYSSLNGSCVWSIYEDPSKNLWFGTYGGGVFYYDKNGAIKNYKTAEGLPADVIFSLYEDSKKVFWVGTNQGLAHFNKDRFICFDTTFKNTITYIFEDRNKQLFLCTDKGLATINNNKIVELRNKGLEKINARFLYEDADGVLWIGTHGDGLIRFKNGTTFSFSSTSTPLDNNVWSITEDASGNFWLPSNSGIYVIPRKELNDFAEGVLKNLNPTFLSKEDGLKSIEFNGGFQPTVLQSKKGEFWFPTVKGIAIVNPTDLKKSDYFPQLIIENIFVDDLEVETKDTLSMKSSASNLIISFTAPSFVNPSKLNFQYKIEGIDNVWINISTNREIKLSNIPYGTHALRIRISGNINNKETILILSKQLPFWKETKFITASIFIFVLIMLITTIGTINIIRKRERKKTQLNKQYANIELKALQAQMNPHFIFNCLNSIQHYIILNDEVAASKYLTKFSMLMRMFLEHSKSNTVTLHDEIELLRL